MSKYDRLLESWPDWRAWSWHFRWRRFDVSRGARDAVGERAILVTADSETYPAASWPRRGAWRGFWACDIWWSPPMSSKNQDYARNPANRCFFCKEELFGTLEPIARREGPAPYIWGQRDDWATTGPACSPPDSGAYERR